MALTVEIDSRSGFCGGVIRAITTAEKFLADHEGTRLYSLGSMVHNEEELARLASKGLLTIQTGDLEGMVHEGDDTLLIRAHGEPPETYALASRLGYDVVDCTCPVVLRLQEAIRDAYQRLHEGGRNGQIIIFGKVGHAEVLGLVGQVGGDALVIEDKAMLESALWAEAIRTDGPIEIFSQTTKSPVEYAEICSLLESRMAAPGLLTVHNTICQQVASRHEVLEDFARCHDVIVFVSGKSSSNGAVLCNLCRMANIRTYHIGSPADIRREWFRDDDKVGVCGATSTPKWLLEDVARTIENFA